MVLSPKSIFESLCYAKSLQSCSTLQPYGLPGSSVQVFLQARIVKWVAVPSSRESSWPREQTLISYISFIGRGVLCQWRHLGGPLESLCSPKSVSYFFQASCHFCSPFPSSWPPKCSITLTLTLQAFLSSANGLAARFAHRTFSLSPCFLWCLLRAMPPVGRVNIEKWQHVH